MPADDQTNSLLVCSRIKFRQLPGQCCPHQRDVTRERDRGVSQILAGSRLHRRHPGQSVGHPDNVAGDAMAVIRPALQPAFVVVRKRHRQRRAERYAVLDAGVHALPARGAVDVRGIAAKQNPVPARAFATR